jgi:hypothetical protein
MINAMTAMRRTRIHEMPPAVLAGAVVVPVTGPDDEAFFSKYWCSVACKETWSTPIRGSGQHYEDALMGIVKGSHVRHCKGDLELRHSAHKQQQNNFSPRTSLQE